MGENGFDFDDGELMAAALDEPGIPPGAKTERKEAAERIATAIKFHRIHRSNEPTAIFKEDLERLDHIQKGARMIPGAIRDCDPGFLWYWPVA